MAGVIAQRLVRRLCDKCKTECYPTEEEARLVMSNEEDVQRFMKMKIYKPGKCDGCNKEGYKGRIGLYEVMQITKEIKKLIADTITSQNLSRDEVIEWLHRLNEYREEKLEIEDFSELVRN